ncbi:MAG: hypothetical protein V2A54_03950 [Bacteroidota bacterium]
MNTDQRIKELEKEYSDFFKETKIDSYFKIILPNIDGKFVNQLQIAYLKDMPDEIKEKIKIIFESGSPI